ncbi:MAG TPA: rhomboid family intramembrane serine protease [Bryobacteraceae bacterium]|nr:rhomboid family intramembrane serine protease [Bryobacteraceae bacterium]
MFPLRDTVPGRRPPVVVWALVFLNALVFLHEVQLTPQALQQFINQYALVPARLTAPGGLEQYWWTAITSMFLHGGWLHIIGNMWFLWIFGDNVEDRFGSLGFTALYFLGGIAAAGLEVFTDPHSTVPSLGASGAIAAVLGAYLVLYPDARVITIIPIFIFPWIVSIPAVVWLGIWFLYQWFNGIAVLHAHAAGGVAYWAHVGGFVFGVLVALAARLTEKAPAAAPTSGGRPFHPGYDQEWPFA